MLQSDYKHTYETQFEKPTNLKQYIINSNSLSDNDGITINNKEKMEDFELIFNNYDDKDNKNWNLEKFISNSSFFDLETILTDKGKSLGF